MTMKLFTGPTTPFGRMVAVLAREAEVALEVEVIDVHGAGFLDAHNPLRLIPTLLLADGNSLHDSRVICRFLAAGAPNRGFYPERDDWRFETRLALISGIMDAGVARQGERSRPGALRSGEALSTFERRILKGFASLEGEADEICRDEPRMDRIAAAVLAEYTDFRYGRNWREVAPRLAGWAAAFGRRPAMLATRFPGQQPA